MSDFPLDPGPPQRGDILTDGIESVPMAPLRRVAGAVAAQDLPKPFVMGLDLDQNFAEEFACVGQYDDAQDVNEFR